MSLPGGGVVTMPVDTLGSPDTLTSDTGTVIPGAGAHAQDVLSVTAGEPATHFNLDQLKQIAAGAEIPNIVRITKVETLRKKIIQKFGDGKILAIPAAAPETTSKKRKNNADTDGAGSSKSAGKSARR